MAKRLRPMRFSSVELSAAPKLRTLRVVLVFPAEISAGRVVREVSAVAASMAPRFQAFPALVEPAEGREWVVALAAGRLDPVGDRVAVPVAVGSRRVLAVAVAADRLVAPVVAAPAEVVVARDEVAVALAGAADQAGEGQQHSSRCGVWRAWRASGPIASGSA